MGDVVLGWFEEGAYSFLERPEELLQFSLHTRIYMIFLLLPFTSVFFFLKKNKPGGPLFSLSFYRHPVSKKQVYVSPFIKIHP